MAKVFLSYHRRSAEVAKNLANDIEALGHSVWFDHELSGGQTWWDQILASIRECHVLVFVVEPTALESSACRREFGYAADLGKPILPVMVAEGVSTNLLAPALSRIQLIDYRKPDRETALRLARAFIALPPENPLPDPLPSPPEVPLSYLGSLTEQIESGDLTYQQQSTLVTDLRKSLRDPETGEDARTLLSKLRKRHDLFATIADDIDELFKSVRESQEPHREGKSEVRERLIGALSGGVLGLAVGLLGLTPFGLTGNLLFCLLPVAGGVISGVLCGRQRRNILWSLVGASAGGLLWAMVYWNSDRHDYVFARCSIFGAPPGAIVGAIAAMIFRRNKK